MDNFTVYHDGFEGQYDVKGFSFLLHYMGVLDKLV